MLPALLVSAALAALAAPAAPAAPADVRVIRDVVYGIADGRPLRLDLALPAGPGPHPLVVGLHGGAWKVGDRRELSGFPMMPDFLDYGTDRPAGLIEHLAANGYAAASAGYRLAPAARFPAQIEDAKTAVRFLRANAARYDLDPERVAAWGYSAGGHLAALVGLAGPAAGFEGTLHPEQSSRVRCVLDYFGPADLSLYAASEGIEKAFMVPLLGARYAARPDVYRRASPIEYVSKDAPPFLLVHGTADLMVPVIHSERLQAKLAAAGASAELVTLSGRGHGWTGRTAAETTALGLRFLDRHLRGKR
jgi:acetyl esterase/lipase